MLPIFVYCVSGSACCTRSRRWLCLDDAKCLLTKKCKRRKAARRPTKDIKILVCIFVLFFSSQNWYDAIPVLYYVSSFAYRRKLQHRNRCYALCASLFLCRILAVKIDVCLFFRAVLLPLHVFLRTSCTVTHIDAFPWVYGYVQMRRINESYVTRPSTQHRTGGCAASDHKTGERHIFAFSSSPFVCL